MSRPYGSRRARSVSPPVLPAQQDLAADHLQRRRHQAQDGARGHALATTAFADDADGAALAHIEVHAIEDSQHAAGNLDVGPQATDAKLGLGGYHGVHGQAFA